MIVIMSDGLSVRRVPVPPSVSTGGCDYSSAFAVAGSDTSLPALHWARAVFEDAPGILRPILVAGWRWGLRLSLGLGRPETVVGWQIAEASPARVTLTAASPLIVAFNDALIEDDEIVWVTRVSYRNLLGRIAWTLAAPVHHVTLPRFLARAARPT
jgi:hypothetical protein